MKNYVYILFCVSITSITIFPSDTTKKAKQEEGARLLTELVRGFNPNHDENDWKEVFRIIDEYSIDPKNFRFEWGKTIMQQTLNASLDGIKKFVEKYKVSPHKDLLFSHNMATVQYALEQGLRPNKRDLFTIFKRGHSRKEIISLFAKYHIFDSIGSDMAANLMDMIIYDAELLKFFLEKANISTDILKKIVKKRNEAKLDYTYNREWQTYFLNVNSEEKWSTPEMYKEKTRIIENYINKKIAGKNKQ